MYRIYGLVDPTTHRIRYVGVTRQVLTRRLAEHAYDTRNGRGSMAKHRWLSGLYDRGKQPLIVELDHTKSEKQWEALERLWVRRMRDAGYKLCNLADGGKGNYGIKKSVEVKKRISQSLKIYNKTKIDR